VIVPRFDTGIAVMLQYCNTPMLLSRIQLTRVDKARAAELRRQFGQCVFTQPLHSRRPIATLGAPKLTATLLFKML